MFESLWGKKSKRVFDDYDRALIKLMFSSPPRKRHERKGYEKCLVDLPHPDVERRIEQHQRRILAEVSKKESSVCWGCGVPTPQTNKSPGWYYRWIKMAGFGKKEREMYCPKCFAQYGWPSLPDTEPLPA